jgi:hypothetical protein
MNFNLNLLAQVICQNANITVQNGNAFSINNINGKMTVTLPLTLQIGDENDARILRGGLCHEVVGHGRFTDFSAKRGNTKLHLTMENILEDARIEKASWSVYPKAKQILEESHAVVIKRKMVKRAVTSNSPAEKAAIAILLRLLFEELGYCKGLIEWKEDWNIAVRFFGNDTMNKAWIEAVVGYQTKSTAEVIVYAAKIVEMLQDNQDSQFTNDINPNDFDIGEKLGKAAFSRSSQCNDELDESCTSTGNGTFNPDQDTKGICQRLKSKLSQKLMSIVGDEEDGFSDIGVLDGSQLTNARLGEKFVFTEGGECGHALDTALSIVLDESASMSSNGKDVSCLNAAWAMCGAINQYSRLGLSFMVSSFNNRILFLKQWNQPWKEGNVLGDYDSNNGTHTAPALNVLLQNIMKRKESRKIIFLITDEAAFEDNFTEANINSARSLGVEVHILFIISHAENAKQFYLNQHSGFFKNLNSFAFADPQDTATSMMKTINALF